MHRKPPIPSHDTPERNPMSNKRLDLGDLVPSSDETCFTCGVWVTEENDSGAEQLVGDGTTRRLCQNCYRRDDVVDLRDLSP
jgi:hypothetical protein